MLLGLSNTSEAAAVFVGASKVGVTTVPVRPTNFQDLENVSLP